MHQWVASSGGAIPSNAGEAGREANGEELFVARAVVPGGGLQIGKVRGGLGAALIPFGGREVPVHDYEVLMNPGPWVPASGGEIPLSAVVSGQEADGTSLFVARAHIEGGGLQPGKVRKDFKSAFIPFGGKEVQVNPYEVLVDD
jgi:hypothetical protein